MSRRILRPWAIALLIAATLFPLYWAVISSLTPESELFGLSNLLPTRLVADHYRAVFTERGLGTAVRN